MNEHFSFERLLAYKSARKLVNDIYMLQKKIPTVEKYALGEQVRRSSVSIAANLAEGSGRISAKEKLLSGLRSSLLKSINGSKNSKL
jgi:four helix bundle protein